MTQTRTRSPKGCRSVGESCVGCSTTAVPGAPPSVCWECVRAIALKWWGAIARHATDGEHKCVLCEIGQPVYCGQCAVEAIQAHRARLRDAGHLIQGEPPFAGCALAEEPREAVEREATGGVVGPEDGR